MTKAAKLAEFMHQNRRAFLFCRDESGRPIGYAMQSVRYEPGSLYFSTYARSAKVQHLRADPAVACVVLGQNDGTDAWVSVRGTAEVYRPSVEETDLMVGAESADGRVPDWVMTTVRERMISGKRCVIRVALDEVLAARLPDADDDVRPGDHAT